MAVEYIADLDDPRITVYRSLKKTNQTRGLPHFVVEGEKLTCACCTAGFRSSRSWRPIAMPAGSTSPCTSGLPIYVVDHALIHEIVGFPFHRGVLACGRRIAWPTCKEIVDQDAATSDAGRLSSDRQSRKPGRDRSHR